MEVILEGGRMALEQNLSGASCPWKKSSMTVFQLSLTTGKPIFASPSVYESMVGGRRLVRWQTFPQSAGNASID